MPSYEYNTVGVRPYRDITKLSPRVSQIIELIKDGTMQSIVAQRVDVSTSFVCQVKKRLVATETQNPKHVHHWRISFDKEGNEVGTCYCGATKVFTRPEKTKLRTSYREKFRTETTLPTGSIPRGLGRVIQQW